MKRILLLIILTAAICTLPAEAGSQRKARQSRSSSQVKKERQETTRQIKKAQQLLKENKARTERQLNALNSLNGRIARQTNDIEHLKSNIHEIDSQIVSITDTITAISKDVELLKRNYARSLRQARSRRQELSDINLLFSSETFMQAVKRIGYIRKLDKWRAGKVTTLQEGTRLLNLKKAGLAELKSRQSQQLSRLNVQQDELRAKQQDARQMVSDLRKEERSLRDVLTEKQNRMSQLDRELDRIIAAEQREAEARRRKELEETRRREEAARKTPPDQKDRPGKSNNTEKQDANPVKPTRPDYSRADDSRKLSGTFSSNKGRLLFPVAGNYNVVGRFGRYRHADLSRVEIDNPGIDIEIPAGGSARAVFDGVVSSIFFMDGYHNIVMVRHGQYLTVYANIDRLNVKKGDRVSAGQPLGHIYSDPSDNNRTILHFEVRRERDKLNPLEWVK